jgi:hypothetical protein
LPRRPADRPGSHRPKGSEPGVRGGHRPPLRSQRGARTLPHARRRQDLQAHAVYEQPCWRV